jgi:hypothetical protein
MGDGWGDVLRGSYSCPVARVDVGDEGYPFVFFSITSTVV